MSVPGSYPFPRLGSVNITLPNYARSFLPVIVWDREIGQEDFNSQFHKKAGVYIWFENQHCENKILYVGRSDNLEYRLYQHDHVVNKFQYDHLPGKQADKGKMSQVLVYMDLVQSNKLEPCDLYPNGCDCIPRFFVVVYVVKDAETRSSLERDLIASLNPPMNKAKPKTQWEKHPQSTIQIRKLSRDNFYTCD